MYLILFKNIKSLFTRKGNLFYHKILRKYILIKPVSIST